MKGYTEKQWGRDCKDLPSFIIKRLPVRLTFDNNYFNALYQGIPTGGYTKLVENLLEGIEVRLNCDYLEHKEELDAIAERIVYTGPIPAKEVRSMKETERGRVHMCELMEKMREESAKQRTYEIMDTMIEAGVLSDKDIAMYTNTTTEEVRERRNQKLSA